MSSESDLSTLIAVPENFHGFLRRVHITELDKGISQWMSDLLFVYPKVTYSTPEKTGKTNRRDIPNRIAKTLCAKLPNIAHSPTSDSPWNLSTTSVSEGSEGGMLGFCACSTKSCLSSKKIGSARWESTKLTASATVSKWTCTRPRARSHPW